MESVKVESKDPAPEPATRRTIPEPEHGGLDPEAIIKAFALRMRYSVARDETNATNGDGYQALAFSIRDRLMERWFETQRSYYEQDVKRVYYLSLEFLLGRLLVNNAINLGARPEHEDAMQRLGFSMEEISRLEHDAGLGNGGLGRLAACYLESASTLALPFYGYGIRYEFGIFRQKIVDGAQTEAPDPWLTYGNPWEVPRPDILIPVRFYGRSEFYEDAEKKGRFRWVDTESVFAMAYDLAAPGYENDTVNSLRLWAAKSSREFDLAQFNTGAYVAAVEDKTRSENISKVLYPPDDQYAGRELRLKQQYFFVSATIHDVIRRFKSKPDRKWSELPDKVAIQLNDTHPAVAIPELMRILIDSEGLEWTEAWSLSEKVFGYTNHTVLPEALEAWPRELFGRLLPRHMQIIEEIDSRLRHAVAEKYPNDEARVQRMAILDDLSQTVRMANLAVVGSHSVNGVAALHTDILKTRVLKDFHEFFPTKFHNKTNGVTPRRWLRQANPELSGLIDEAIGQGWTRDLEQLRGLERFASDASFLERWRGVKHARKTKLAEWMGRTHDFTIDVSSLFDVQIKRMHEYKRQLLNVLHLIALFHRIDDGDTSVEPRTVIFAGKAAPSYLMAKKIIRLIHHVAAMVNGDPRASKILKVVFVPNYDVSSAEMLFPATELSEQISTAGTEASGTGCMKAVMNGGIIIGTLDGANIEIRNEVGEENLFVFGHTAAEIATLRDQGSGSMAIIEGDPVLKRVIQRLETWEEFHPISAMLRGGDRFFHCADFASYCETQRRAAATWMRPDEWSRMSLLNSARSGNFSSDRAVAEYARDVWQVNPVPIRMKG
ncbi:MAG TPA: glycogen/starch/alpha-glucan phosphorylase [Thermoanaerobaculia bacterium]|nr:glycogen/starch/alpha-glucan phosphorylase [Thermoanaerobaculia bacterium]